MKLAWTIGLAAVLAGPLEPEKVDFAVLSGFEYQEGMTLPAEVTQYDEREITLSGFMQREDDGIGPVEFFMLIDDACGCEGMPKLNEVVFCAMPEGVTTEVFAGTVEISGKLYIGEEREDDVVVALYVMDVDSVRG